ncbi:33 kDa inner dynein arm light chain, axonemal [Leptopilina heterotoma]|uniref:33 kDa inner dynein arm light chain, axonemal n=1 Tax=Leptopilina heterotoma TaxID=63436 RepID=UPI001CA7F341|nr:33 kDa inner dynein arm light chain, axonemal [Leptopilina heterotoma]XP_043481290.1 33 kDa inner dynein arm light chain, axonemal [Leptopilina heterotoma]
MFYDNLLLLNFNLNKQIMESLVKYDNPVLISTKAEKLSNQRLENKDPDLTNVVNESFAIQKKFTIEIEKEPVDILNGILPPKKWKEEGQQWMQKVSTTPATRLDVINLQEQLDMRLQQRQARENGICPVRRELFNQCFDELIRQVTINCAERGILLLRVRDEIKMTMSAYQTLYQSSVAFGIRKSLQAEQGKEDLVSNLNVLLSEKIELEKSVAELQQKLEQTEKRNAILREAEEKKYVEEILFLKKTNQQLKVQLEGILTLKK